MIHLLRLNIDSLSSRGIDKLFKEKGIFGVSSIVYSNYILKTDSSLANTCLTNHILSIMSELFILKVGGCNILVAYSLKSNKNPNDVTLEYSGWKCKKGLNKNMEIFNQINSYDNSLIRSSINTNLLINVNISKMTYETYLKSLINHNISKNNVFLEYHNKESLVQLTQARFERLQERGIINIIIARNEYDYIIVGWNYIDSLGNEVNEFNPSLILGLGMNKKNTINPIVKNHYVKNIAKSIAHRKSQQAN